VEKLTSLGITEDTRIERKLNYTINLCEPTNASENELFHTRKAPGPIFLQNLLSFLHLPITKTCDKKPLINYNQSHVVIFYEYL
jgi:hypothetical protein